MSEFVVRYGAMRIVGIFTTSGKAEFNHGAYVIARTERGMETAQVLCPMRDDLQKTMEELAKLNKLGTPPHGRIVRLLTQEDLKEVDRIQKQEVLEFETCQRFIRQMNLDMRLVDVEHIFGGERIVVYYLAEGRIDFRELVKVLANEFQTRIEMRQIGVRDEAKLLADFGDCGKEVCCNTYLTIMPSVSMKMAKMQKATLDPSKISGRCGRLKCCLRYEFDTYEEMQDKMPSLGAIVRTPDGDGKVVGHEFLAEKVQVEMSDFQILSVPITEITILKEAFDERALQYADSDADTNAGTNKQPLTEDFSENSTDRKSRPPRKSNRYPSNGRGSNATQRPRDRNEPPRDTRNESKNVGQPDKPESSDNLDNKNPADNPDKGFGAGL